MIKSFTETDRDRDHDKITALDDIVAELLGKEVSVTKQIFTYISENTFLSIDSMDGHPNIMEGMYSEFLKYAFGDGKESGIALTPSYIAKMVPQVSDIDENSEVMDLMAGSAGFLIFAMKLMIECVRQKYGKDTAKANKKVDEMKQ